MNTKQVKTIGLSRHKTLRHTASATRPCYTICGRDFSFGNMRLTSAQFPEATCTGCAASQSAKKA